MDEINANDALALTKQSMPYLKERFDLIFSVIRFAAQKHKTSTNHKLWMELDEESQDNFVNSVREIETKLRKLGYDIKKEIGFEVLPESLRNHYFCKFTIDWNQNWGV